MWSIQETNTPYVFYAFLPLTRSGVDCLILISRNAQVCSPLGWSGSPACTLHLTGGEKSEAAARTPCPDGVSPRPHRPLPACSAAAGPEPQARAAGKALWAVQGWTLVAWPRVQSWSLLASLDKVHLLELTA